MASIKMRTTSAGPLGVRQEGHVYHDVPEDEARALVDGGYAAVIETADAPPVERTADAAIEDATAAPPERAAGRRRGR